MARFCGVYSPRNPGLASRQQAERMLAALLRHIPETESWYVDEKAGIVLAALSHDAQPEGPDWVQQPDQIAVLNGFVTAAGPYSIERRGGAGAERVLQVQAAGGSLEELAGEFALAAWDSGRGELTLAVDPFSNWPLYYQRDDATGLTIFASEPKCILAHPLGCREMDPAAMAFYLFETHVSPPLTAYRGMRRVHCGERLTLKQDGTMASTFDWSYPGPAAEDPGLDYWSNEVSDRHNAHLQNLIAGHQRIGLLLGAGIDSSLLYGRLKTMFPEVEVVPITGYYPETPLHKYEGLDLPYARRLAAHWGDPLIEMGLTFDSLYDSIEPVLRQTDQPYMNIGNNTAVLAMARRASELGVSMLIGGQGAGENFSMISWAEIREAQQEGRLLTIEEIIGHYNHKPLQFDFGRVQKLMLEPPSDPEAVLRSTFQPMLDKVVSPRLFDQAMYGIRPIIPREHILHTNVAVMTMWPGRFANAFFDWNTVKYGATVPPQYKGSEDNALRKAVVYHRDRHLIPDWVFQRSKRGLPGFPFDNGLFPRLEKRMLSRELVEKHGVFDPGYFEKVMAKRKLRKSLLMAQMWLDIHLFQTEESFDLIAEDYKAFRQTAQTSSSPT